MNTCNHTDAERAMSDTPERKNNWMNRQRFVVSAEQHAAFKRLKKLFNCKICGRVFKVGDTARWIYANSTPGMQTGNFFVCGDCDGDDPTVLAKAKEQFELAVKLAKQWDIYGPDWQRDP